MDMKQKTDNDMDHSRVSLCPLCKSDCPSKRFTEFPLRLKDPNPTPTPFQENVEPSLRLKDPNPTPTPFQENVKPSPETPKSRGNIYRYMSRTPQVKRKMFDNLNTPLPTPAPDRIDQRVRDLQEI